MTSDGVIETFELTKRYGRRGARSVLAVDGVSLSVERGQVFGFLGPNGSGKTTTIGMLVGVVRPTAGSFSLLGAAGPRELVAARARVGATLETPNFYPYMSGRDNLRIATAIKGADRARVEECLELVGLADRAGHRFGTYSLGMKQRLSLAATMLNDPELVVLDEPANGLDPQGMREIRAIIRDLADRGTTIFLSSHLLWEVERVCSHVAIVRKGRIVASGPVEEIASGDISALVRAEDETALLEALAEYPDGKGARRGREGVIVSLASDDLAALNRYLAGCGIHLSHLARHRQSLEEVFVELTGAGDSRTEGGA